MARCCSGVDYRRGQSGSSVSRSLRVTTFVGRWPTFNAGHLWLVTQKLPVHIVIRPTDEDPPIAQRKERIIEVMDEAGYRYGVDFTVA